MPEVQKPQEPFTPDREPEQTPSEPQEPEPQPARPEETPRPPQEAVAVGEI